MIGTVMLAFAEAIRMGARLGKLDPTLHVSTVFANDRGEGTVNVPLPTVAIFAEDMDRPTNPIGGEVIIQRMRIVLSVITDFENQSISPDRGHQVKLLDLSDRVLIWIEHVYRYGYIENEERVNPFKTLKENYNFSIMSDGTDTYQTQGVRNKVKKQVVIHRLKYICPVTRNEYLEHSGDFLPEDGIIMNCKCDQTFAARVPEKNNYIAKS